MRECQILVQRPLNDWEIGECNRLLGTLSQVTLGDGRDILVWSQTEKECSLLNLSTGSFSGMMTVVNVSHIGRFGR